MSRYKFISKVGSYLLKYLIYFKKYVLYMQTIAAILRERNPCTKWFVI